MKALCWYGVNDLRIEKVPDPQLINPRDAIVKVGLSSVCGSDLHLLDGYIPTMQRGDIIGHEFMGEIVEVGSEIKNLRRGDRVVVPSTIACGNCYFCQHDLWSLCDNGNPNASAQEKVYGYPTSGIYGYSHLFGGYAGSHAEYIRVPYADVGAFKVPDGLTDEQVVFISDAFPTGYMAAENCNIQPGDTVAVWGCGAVGQFAIRSAYMLGAARVIAIDEARERLRIAAEGGAETLNFRETKNIPEALKELTHGRGPDSVLDAVGMESHGVGVMQAYDALKQSMRLQTDRAYVLREAILACRKGGTLSIIGVYAGVIDKFPLGIAFNKGLHFNMGQMHGQKYTRNLLERVQQGQIDPSFAVTHRMPLAEAPHGYNLFKSQANECMRVVFAP